MRNYTKYLLCNYKQDQVSLSKWDQMKLRPGVCCGDFSHIHSISVNEKVLQLYWDEAQDQGFSATYRWLVLRTLDSLN